MLRIDAHIHFLGDHTDSVALLEDLDLKLFNIVVAHGARERWSGHARLYKEMARKWPERYAWCTSFGLEHWGEPDFAERAIADLERDFAEGALACKVWKNVGMELRDPDGSFVHIDDPRFDPVLEYLAGTGKPVLMHIGEPLACWRPLQPGRPHYDYYSRNPEWHMYGRTDMPAHEEIIAHRDHMLERHPRLRVIGAHLGSLEYDVAEVARRLHRYPNFAVDISARLDDLAYQDSDLVGQLFLDFPDRVLFGTDLVLLQAQSRMAGSERAALLEKAREEFLLHFRYFETGGPLCVRGRETRGLALPPAVLDRFYAENARSWYPGL